MNSGSLTSRNGKGINLPGVQTFSGGIDNQPAAPSMPRLSGIFVSGTTIFAGGITNAGTITGGAGIVVSQLADVLVGRRAAASPIRGIDFGRRRRRRALLRFRPSTAISPTAAPSAPRPASASSAARSAGRSLTAARCLATASAFRSTVRARSARPPTAIEITGPTFTGGITNAGTLSVSRRCIPALPSALVSTFAGGITNSGTITAGGDGITVQNVVTFSAGVSNTGTISAVGDHGILVNAITSFTGGIANTGAVIAGTHGVYVLRCLRRSGGGVSNTRTIAAGKTGIFVDAGHRASPAASPIGATITATAGAASTCVSVTTFSGNISNAGTITATTGILITSQA